jgi:hypothetical protein
MGFEGIPIAASLARRFGPAMPSPCVFCLGTKSAPGLQQTLKYVPFAGAGRQAR